MSTDNRIGLQAVGSVVRTAAPRKVGSEGTAPMPSAAPVKAMAEAVPVSRLIGMASELADKGPPIDVSRVAALRSAIAGGHYAADPDKIASAMIRFHEGAN
ncbi:MAG: flagellar biosynthesis anti-sigma factor FlgM [Sphingopyxis sp.]|uniref:flagellar biosynthesis anti-sigma factor FlgM n=1 Tax=Sphingopyxis sp. TaxID=1908224 RepID=UPI002ABB9EF4|nr:flagellar biosynthesis anti-sigma factor FlgM [Sphingopyxis sp.]MDZ3831861.1 flagellar biosynthesis anti-sigma factor FlgM [Sphingopyxis sp.]